MTSKERASLRAQANDLTPVLQIGKSGIGQALIQSLDQALTARELIKIRVLLDSSPIRPKEAAAELASATGADIVSVVGGVIVFYRYSKERHEKEQQKKSNIRRAEKVRRLNAKRRAKLEKDRNFRRNV